MGKLVVAGLRSCSKEDIPKEISRFKQKGWLVEHKTCYKNGDNLPYNGVLLLRR